MVLYYSGTGNSKYAAEKIAEGVQDQVINLFEKIRTHDCTPLKSVRPWVIVTPTYAWRIPRIVREWLKETLLEGNQNISFVMTCGSEIGNAGKYLKQLCDEKGMIYRGCAEIVMPENYIAMFKTPGPEEAREIVSRADRKIDDLIRVFQENKPLPEAKITPAGRLASGPVNGLFYTLFVRAKKFYATNQCVSCGLCEKVCPVGNVRLNQGMPVWGTACTHCMACICRCPKEAIEYGKHSRGLPRYTMDKLSEGK